MKKSASKMGSNDDNHGETMIMKYGENHGVKNDNKHSANVPSCHQWNNEENK